MSFNTFINEERKTEKCFFPAGVFKIQFISISIHDGKTATVTL